jgi:YidC/Oxa1 family membrane protein insertase
MEQRNLIIAIAVSVAILIGSQAIMAIFFPPKPVATTEQTASTGAPAAPSDSTAPSGSATAPSAPAAAPEQPLADRSQAIAAAPRIAIHSPRLSGSIDLKGGRLDDLVLNDYRETVDPSSPNIVLLSPVGAANAYYADFGWVAQEPGVALPNAETVWQAEGDQLAPGHAVTLTWDNGQGLKFERRFELDENFMFKVTQRVENTSGQTVTLFPYGLVARYGTPHLLNIYVVHEGLLGVLDGKLQEVKYKDLREKNKIDYASTGGWLGITDKYWLVALIPDQKAKITARFGHALQGKTDLYQADYRGDATPLTSGGSTETTTRLFAGAKVVNLLDRYGDQDGIPLFNRAVDFGYLFFLTIPIFHVLDFLYGLIGNFGLSILALTVLIRLLLFPLANKSYKAMSKMKALGPEMTKLKERFKDDKAKMQQEIMALYKREKVNPAAGCLPILIQIPIFFSLYKVLSVTIEMRHAPFFGWIQDLSAKDPTSILNLFGLLPYHVPDLGPINLINIGIWPLVMGFTMWMQQRLNPAPPDPVQAKIMAFLPVIFTLMLGQYTAGLVIYWAWNNTLSVAQQRFIMWRMGIKT